MIVFIMFYDHSGGKTHLHTWREWVLRLDAARVSWHYDRIQVELFITNIKAVDALTPTSLLTLSQPFMASSTSTSPAPAYDNFTAKAWTPHCYQIQLWKENSHTALGNRHWKNLLTKCSFGQFWNIKKRPKNMIKRLSSDSPNRGIAGTMGLFPQFAAKG